jgi:uncharacterized membrane protein
VVRSPRRGQLPERPSKAGAPSLSRLRPDSWLPYGTAGAAAAFFAAIAIYRHDRFATGGYDLGIFDQTIWGYSRFHIIRNTVKGVPDLLGDHFHPALMALAPLYWIWNDARVLLVAQAILIAVASVPISWWGRTRLGARAGLCVQCAFLVFWGVLAGVVFDFHELALAAPAIAFGVYALLERRTWLFWSMLVVGCLAKEDIALTFAAMGVYAIVAQRRLPFGLAVVSTGVGWFSAALFLIIPAIAGHPYAYWNYPALGPTPAKALLALVERPYRALALLVDRPEKRATLAQLFGAWLFLPLASPLLLIAVPSIAERFWANNPSLWSTSFQYTLPVSPILAFATIDALHRIRRRRPTNIRLTGRLLPLAAAGCSLVLTLAVARPLAPLLGYMSAERAAATDSCLDTIPAEASVAASSHLIPHLTHRADISPLYRSRNAQYLAVAGSSRSVARTLRAGDVKSAPAPLGAWYRLVCRSGDATVLERQPGGARVSATSLVAIRSGR